MEECTVYQNGRLLIREFFQDGRREGDRKVWYSSGRIFKHTFYQGGNPEGKHRSWYETGVPSSRQFYRTGKHDGECKYWRDDGQICIHEFYQNGKALDNDFSVNKKRLLVKMRNKLRPRKFGDVSNLLIKDLISDKLHL